MMVEIKEGPELNRAVAEAIGWTYPVFGGKPLGLYEIIPNEAVETPASDPVIPDEVMRGLGYSTDLNAAFAAAEKVELFRQYGYCEYGYSGQHVISKTVPFKSWGDTVAHEATPALAICAAILKLREP